MKFFRKRYRIRQRFDFEVGYLVKSPCRECSKRKELPGCADNCVIIDKIHLTLTEVISCAKGG